jgi:signal transduction histidine kinase/CheY-like chemotaxis protein
LIVVDVANGGGERQGGATAVPRTLRAKLVFIVAAAALSLVTLIGTGMLVTARVEKQLSLIQLRYVPKLELGPKLESDFERIGRSLQDAAAAQDASALAESSKLKNALCTELLQAESALGTVEVALARNAIDDYYVLALDISQRLIQGETGEELIAAISAMQAKQARALESLHKVVAFDRNELGAAFAAVSRTQHEATRIRLAVSLTCLLVVSLLYFWLSRGILRGLAGLAEGFERFGRGAFDQPIVLNTRDELAGLAERANLMARSLQRLNQERDRSDWLKEGNARLAHELRGELELAEVADCAVSVLARYLEAPIGALCYEGSDGRFRRIGHYAMSAADSSSESQAFGLGEGLVGEAAQRTEITIVKQVPEGYLPVRSGLGSSSPSQLVLVPLVQLGRVVGVLELGCFAPFGEQHSELLLSVRESVAIALEVARGRAALRELLAETQSQARRLAEQEEELRASNEELLSQQDELRVSNRALNASAQKLEAQRMTLEHKNSELNATRQVLEKNAAELTTVSAYKTQFLNNMSHELRTPLNSMLLLSNLLAANDAGNLSDKQVEYCRTIHGAGEDLLALINQVLDLAKIESGKQQVQLDVVPLLHWIDHAQRIFGPVARQKGLELKTELAPQCPSAITTDTKRVEQILNNLLGNALKFTEHGAVTLRIAPAGPDSKWQRPGLTRDATLEISVSDTGIGIAAEHLERIFAPFEQADAGQERRSDGTGLGLTISRQLAALLGGELSVGSVLGHGTTFVCYLPYTFSNAEARAPTLALPGPTGQPLSIKPDPIAPERSEPPVLIVEDESDHAHSLSELLQSEHVEVIRAANAAQALALLEKEALSCVVLDLGLPDMDGLELVELMGQRHTASPVPVVVYTGRPLSKTELQRLESYSEAVVLKGGAGAQRVVDEVRNIRQRLKAGVRSSARGPISTDNAAPRLDGRKVLIADDDMRTVYALSALLRAKGAEVVVADNGIAALSALEAEPSIDILLLDIMMPEMDGYETLRHIRMQPRLSKLPVIALTAKALQNDRQKCVNAGATGYVAKPVDPEKLVELVHHCLVDTSLKGNVATK